MSLSKKIKPVTVRMFEDNLMDFQDFINVMKRRLEDLSIAESEAMNAAAVAITKISTPEGRQAVAKRRSLSKEDTEVFEAWCDWFMEDYVKDLEEVMSRRDAMDKRKTRTAAE
ncbi:hypothetical protein [Nocardia sp. NPDC051750]|uniref:hypothetical protein n=1 Tax=Nocardia sp. NPDC051750 TaxID=3364325 RepID=UPI003794C7F8